MKSIPGARKIDLSCDPRRDHFAYFSTMAYPYVGLTAQVDISPIVGFRKRTGAPFFLTLLYCVGRAANSVPQPCGQQSTHHLGEGRDAGRPPEAAAEPAVPPCAGGRPAHRALLSGAGSGACPARPVRIISGRCPPCAGDCESECPARRQQPPSAGPRPRRDIRKRPARSSGHSSPHA